MPFLFSEADLIEPLLMLLGCDGPLSEIGFVVNDSVVMVAE
jgi:hypothetical protein